MILYGQSIFQSLPHMGIQSCDMTIGNLFKQPLHHIMHSRDAEHPPPPPTPPKAKVLVCKPAGDHRVIGSQMILVS